MFDTIGWICIFLAIVFAILMSLPEKINPFEKIVSYRTQKEAEKHKLLLLEWEDFLNEQDRAFEFEAENITSQKQKIDTYVEQLKYLPETQLEYANAKLEEMKIKLFENMEYYTETWSYLSQWGEELRVKRQQAKIKWN